MYPFRRSFLPVDGGDPVQFCAEARVGGMELRPVLWAVAFRRVDGQAGRNHGAEGRQFDVQGRRAAF